MSNTIATMESAANTRKANCALFAVGARYATPSDRAVKSGPYKVVV